MARWETRPPSDVSPDGTAGRRDSETTRPVDFDAALDVLGEAIVVYDAAGRLVYCNSRFREIYGYSRDEARPGVHFRALGEIDVARGNVVVGDEYGGADAYLARKAEYRRTLKGSFTVQLKDGRWLKTTDRAIPGGGFVSVQADVTELKRAEAEMARAKAEAERSNNAKSDFLARMSHDLRTPLNSILGFSELIAAGADLGPDGERVRGYVDAVHTAGVQLHALINDILDIAKVEAGQLSLEEEAVDLTAEVSACLRQARGAGRAGIAATRLTADISPILRADPRRLRQILSNLLSNALKFTPPEAEVEAAIVAADDGGCAILVKDRGPGVPEADLARILLPFEQAGGSALSRASTGGAGLGLAIAKSLTELHGGDLTLENRAGGGLVVRVVLPAERILGA
ncbi:MAG: PAS-domain containing protein [Marivibrio sp.]|uniref:sensor histidine kinase n=1 Tax=Marivibrio sp. TaxID=2039719 RepID=UPI0032EBD6D3